MHTNYSFVLIIFLLLILCSCNKEEAIDIDPILSEKEVNTKAWGPPVDRNVVIKPSSSIPTYLKGQIVKVVVPDFIRNNSNLNNGLTYAINTLNAVPNFDITFTRNKFITSPHQLTFQYLAFPPDDPPTACYGRAFEFVGDINGSNAKIQVGNGVSDQFFTIVRSLFVHEIMHTIGFLHPDSTSGIVACVSNQRDGVMENCICDPAGISNSFSCHTTTPNSCEKIVLASLY